MRGSLAILACLILCGEAAHWPAQEPDDLPQVVALEKTLQKAIARAEPAIACILVSRNEIYRKLDPAVKPDDATGRLGIFNPQDPKVRTLTTEEERKKLDLSDPSVVPESFGSGIVIDARGLILTNYHVVRDAVKIFVRLPGNKASYADIHAADPRSDLAVLQVLEPITPLPMIALGDGGRLQRGQFILSLANPYAAGFRDGQPSASWGILSNIRRRIAGPPHEEERIKSLHHYGTLLQLDARLNFGCSGGALLNLKGELVGVTSALAAIHGGETPGGFAIPLDAGFRRILDVLKRGEEVEYGFLGVSLKEQSPGPGVVVSSVVENSPAMEAGVQTSDRILAIDGVPIAESDDLFLQLGTHLAGNKVRIEVRRSHGAFQTLDTTLVKFQPPGKRIYSSLGKRPYFRGLRIDYASLLVRPSPQSKIPKGVMVSDVQPDSPAASAKLRPGDVISHVNGQPVSSPANFYQVIGTLRGPLDLTLITSPLERDTRHIIVKLNPS